MTDLTDALGAAKRAQSLARDLDIVRDPGTISQVSSGLQHEIRTITDKLSAALSALEDAAVGTRPGKVRNDALATSRAAGASVVRAGSKRASVLLALYRKGPLTDLELQEHLAMPASTERPRRVELVDAQLVMPATYGGEAVTKPHNGRAWQVWRLTRAGITAALRIAQGAEAASDWQPESVAPEALF